jgi:iron-sulfur cluster repair protein YtfE (RIC family)
MIEELKLDHAELSDLFRKIVHLGITSEEGRKSLHDAKATLLAHLKKEDDELYPVLWEMAKDNQNLKLKLESLANDLGNVTRTISAFFEKYADGEHETDFKADFQKLYLILSRRINNEERVLFTEYDLSELL